MFGGGVGVCGQLFVLLLFELVVVLVVCLLFGVWSWTCGYCCGTYCLARAACGVDCLNVVVLVLIVLVAWFGLLCFYCCFILLFVVVIVGLLCLLFGVSCCGLWCVSLIL